jgi:hypothetical protein
LKLKNKENVMACNENGSGYLKRQGDVLLVRLDGAKLNREHVTRVEPDKKRGVVLAYGEVTGHAHALDPQVCSLFVGSENAIEGVDIEKRMAELSGGVLRGLLPTDRLLTVRAGTTLRHTLPGGGPSGDHGDVPLEEGVYVVRRQREYDPEMERLIAD